MGALIVLVPLLGAGLAAVLPLRRLGVLSVLSGLIVLLAGVWSAASVEHGRVLYGAHGLVRLDALSAVMVLLIGALASLAGAATARTVALDASEPEARRRGRLYVVLVQLFLAAMLGAVLAANLGVLWVMIEATTIATTFLVGHQRSAGAVEAAWKYVVLCGVGIALAFLGLVLIYFASAHTPAGAHAASLDWSSLRALAPHLDPRVTRLGVALVVLGFGTKVGLAPLHAWLPDAHSQAPAPVSALMSGVLLSVALYAILRVRVIADLALGVGFVRALLVVLGLSSLAVAAALLIAQRDLKRLLAYSSVEHMGLAALGVAAGTPLGLAAVLLHVLGHGLAKSALFLGAGQLHHDEGTTRLDELGGVLRRRPGLGGAMTAGFAALLGLPPFSLFVSELAMARAEVAAGLTWALGLALVLISVAFVAIARHARGLLFGGDGPSQPTPPGVLAPLVIALVGSLGLGVLAWPLSTLLHAASGVLA